MFLSELELKNFRNYSVLQLHCTPQVNIFFGQNAQGKTNILEAIALLSLGKSFRTKKELEMIQWGTEVSFTAGEFRSETDSTHISFGISKNEKRVKLNGQATKVSEIFGRIPVVIFSPDDLQLIKGGPQLRRDFIDLYLAQIEPKYRFIFYNFYKVMQHRNRLLKDGYPDLKELEVWDEQFVEKAAKVIKYRLSLLEQIKPYIIRAQSEISGNKESLNLEYVNSKNQPLVFENEDAIKRYLANEISVMRKPELERGITLVGPQRDDLRITIENAIELRNFGSQGQQRTASLALKLGLIEQIYATRGMYPIMLLDDVMSEFDDERKQALLQMVVSSTQTFMTSTSRRDFPISNQETVFFQVVQGAVNRVQ